MLNFLINKILEWRGVPTTHSLLSEIPEDEKKEYSALARKLLEDPVFTWVIEHMRLKAERMMFKGDKSKESFYMGKGMIYSLETLVNSLADMSKEEFAKTKDRKEKVDMAKFVRVKIDKVEEKLKKKQKRLGEKLKK